MAKFKPGQEAVCTEDVKWSVSNKEFMGPKKDEIVTVEGYPINLKDHIFLKEYQIEFSNGMGAYPEKYFEPVVPQAAIQALMEEISEPVKNEFLLMAQNFSSVMK